MEALETVDIEKAWTEKVEKLSVKIKAIARGNEDFYQEGVLGIRAGLLRDPYATDSYLLQASRFAMGNYKNRGKSIDNGSKHSVVKKLSDGTIKTYKKDMTPVHVDMLDSELRLRFPDNSCAPDVLAFDRISAEEFYNSLDEDEARRVDACIRVLDSNPHNAKAILGKARDAVYEKFARAFGIAEEAVCQ